MHFNTGLYEIRLREEFKNMRWLQQDTAMRKVLALTFVDRVTGSCLSVLDNPSTTLFPEQYKVRFTMPVYTAKGILNRAWQGNLTVTLAQEILMASDSYNVPAYQLDTSNGIPFNHHISQGYFCSGGLWSVAKEYGLWYFIIGCGSIINQESNWMDDRGFGHLNNDAYLFWKNDRRKEKISDISWPFDLRSRIEIVDRPATQPARIKICQPIHPEIYRIRIITNN